MTDVHYRDALTKNRSTVLARLTEEFEETRSSREARLVLIVGDRGQGRTSLLRTFFEHLAAGQTPPPYWPSQLTERSLGPGVLSSPLTVGPDFVWPSDSVPDWLWIGVSSHHAPTGEAIALAPQIAAALSPHLPAVWARWLTLRPARHLTSELVRRLRELARQDAPIDVSTDLLQALVEAHVGIELPLVGLGFLAAKRTFGVVAQARSALAQFHADTAVDLSAAQTSYAKTLARELRQLARPGLPIILAIDDVEHAHVDCLRLIDELLPAVREDDAPVMVVATTTERALASGELRDSYIWLVERRRTTELALRPASAADLREMVKQAAPRTLEGVAESIAKHYRTPKALALFLESPLAARRTQFGQLLASDEELHEWPLDVRSFIDEALLGYSDDERRALGLAFAVTPFGIASHGYAWWHPSCLSHVARRIGFHDAESLLAPLQGSLWQFIGELGSLVDPEVADACADLSVAEFGSERLEIRNAVGHWAAKWLDGDEPVSVLESTVVAQLLHSLRASGYSLSDREQYLASAISVALSVETRDVANFFDAVKDLQQNGYPADASLRRRLYRSLLDGLVLFGEVGAAWQLLSRWTQDSAVRALDEVGGDQTVLDQATTLAHLAGLSGQPEFALRTLDHLIRQAASRDEKPRALAVARNAYGVWLTQTGRFEEALEQYDQVMATLTEDELRELSGLTVLENRALALAQSGNTNDAYEELMKVIATLEEQFPEDLATRLRLEHNVLASCWQQIDETSRSERAAGLLNSRSLVAGLTHRDTIASWSLAVELMHQAGRIDEMFAMVHDRFEPIAWSAQRSDPNVVMVCAAMSEALLERGAPAVAYEWADSGLRRLLPDGSERIAVRVHRAAIAAAFAVDDPGLAMSLWTVLLDRLSSQMLGSPAITRARVAVGEELAKRDDWFAAAHEYARASESVAASAAPDERILAYDLLHRSAKCQINGALSASSLSLLEPALEGLRQLRDDCVRDLGRDHPLTLRVRATLARVLRVMGLNDEVLAEVSAVLQSGTLDADEEIRFSVLNDRFGALVASNRHTDAIAESSELLQAASKANMGPREQLTVRHNIAMARFFGGQTEEARRDMAEVVRDREATLGADDPDTETSRAALSTMFESDR